MEGQERESWMSRHFPSLTRQSLLRHYIPMAGGLSHAIFSVQFLNPRFLEGVVGSYDLAVTNALFFNAHIGVAFYLYYRPHMSAVNTRTRVMYCVYTSCLMNFGGVLLWAVTKNILLPHNAYLRAAFGIITSFCIFAVGRDYVGYIDSLFSKGEIKDE